MAHPYWPLFDLVVRTPRLELRLPNDSEIGELIEIARAGIHDHGYMPFHIAWSTLRSPEFEESFAQFHWRSRASFAVDEWALPLAVFVAGRPVGTQSLLAQHFPRLRSVSTGSWLGREYHGRGLGTEMRSGVLHLAFVGLDALEAHSAARRDNQASLRVSEKLGYEHNGVARLMMGDGAVDCVRLRIDRSAWEATRREDIEISGLDGCRRLFVGPADPLG